MLLAPADDDGDDGDEDNDGDVLLAPASQLLLVQLDCCSCRWNWKCPHLESLPWTGKSQTNIDKLINDYTSKLLINYFPEVLALENQDWWKFQSNFHDNCDGTQVAIHIKSMQRLIQRKHECLKMSHFTTVDSENIAIIELTCFESTLYAEIVGLNSIRSCDERTTRVDAVDASL